MVSACVDVVKCVEDVDEDRISVNLGEVCHVGVLVSEKILQVHFHQRLHEEDYVAFAVCQSSDVVTVDFRSPVRSGLRISVTLLAFRS
jgi:hypothetical protein